MLAFLNRLSKYIFWSFLFWIVFRVFVFQFFNVPGVSMKSNLNEGDFIMVNKLSFGARIPITPIAFGDYYLDFLQLPYLRIPGYSEIKNEDIIVFNSPQEKNKPIDLRTPTVKRCIAKSGQILQIKNGQIYINSKLQKGIRNILLPANDSGNYVFKDSSTFNPNVFPFTSKIHWNEDNFGPIRIPKKGDKIVLNEKNKILYSKLIADHENAKIDITESKVYTFTMNYYFVLGDNRSKSIDSRFWGFLPENHIIGKVDLIF